MKLNKFSGCCSTVPMISQSFLFNPTSIRLYLLMRFLSRAFLTNAFAPGAIFSIGINRRSATVCPADRKCCPTGVLVLTWHSCVTVPTWSASRSRALRCVSPRYCGLSGHFVQVARYRTFSLWHVNFPLICNSSPVLLIFTLLRTRPFVVSSPVNGHILQPFPHLLKPSPWVLKLGLAGGGSLALQSNSRHPGQHCLASYCQIRCRTVNMIERHIKGGQKSIPYKQLGLSMDIETKVVQHVSSPKESNLTTWQP